MKTLKTAFTATVLLMCACTADDALYSEYRVFLKNSFVTPSGTILESAAFGDTLLAGGSVNCIGASSYKAYTWFGDNAQYAVSEQEADLDDKTAFNYTVFYGFRLNCFSFKRFNAYIEHSHHYMLLPLNNSANRYNNSDLLYNHLFVPDDIRLSFNPPSTCSGKPPTTVSSS